MKRFCYLLISFLSINFFLFAQAPPIQWQKSLGGTSRDNANAIQNTPDGGYIVAGYADSNDGDVSGNHGQKDMWLVKLNSLGGIQWQKCLGGNKWEYAFAIKLTLDGGYIVAGYAESNTGDVSGNHNPAGYPYDMWVVKLNNTGVIEWQKCLGGSGGETANDIEPTPDGGYIVVGNSASNNDGDVSGHHTPPFPQSDFGDAWVVKLSNTGAIQWQKSFGGSSKDDANSVQNTPDGGYIVAASTNSNDGDVINTHGGDIWILKLTTIGDIQWQKCLGGSGGETASSIKLTPDGGYIVAGFTDSYVAYNMPGPYNGDVSGVHGSEDMWVVKLNSVGAIQWQKCLGGTGLDRASGVELTSDGGYILSGVTYSNDGDVVGQHRNGPGYSENIFDMWVVKLSDTGDLQWQKCLGGYGGDAGNAIQVTPDGGCIVAGYTISGDGDVTNLHNSMDMWVVKLGNIIPNNICQSVQSGSWNDLNTWTCRRIPNSLDNVTIKAGHVVSIPSGDSKAKKVTFSGGELIYISATSKLLINVN